LYPSLFNFLKNNKGATIVYVTLQKQTEELAAELRRKGFKARSFHAGMETGTKTQLQDEFMREEELVIVATIAFGMGMHISVFPYPHPAITPLSPNLLLRNVFTFF
jgi:superfamily II DNA helicase RecQ